MSCVNGDGSEVQRCKFRIKSLEMSLSRLRDQLRNGGGEEASLKREIIEEKDKKILELESQLTESKEREQEMGGRILELSGQIDSTKNSLESEVASRRIEESLFRNICKAHEKDLSEAATALRSTRAQLANREKELSEMASLLSEAVTAAEKLAYDLNAALHSKDTAEKAYREKVLAFDAERVETALCLQQANAEREHLQKEVDGMKIHVVEYASKAEEIIAQKDAEVDRLKKEAHAYILASQMHLKELESSAYQREQDWIKDKNDLTARLAEVTPIHSSQLNEIEQLRTKLETNDLSYKDSLLLLRRQLEERTRTLQQRDGAIREASRSFATAIAAADAQVLFEVESRLLNERLQCAIEDLESEIESLRRRDAIRVVPLASEISNVAQILRPSDYASRNREGASDLELRLRQQIAAMRHQLEETELACTEAELSAEEAKVERRMTADKLKRIRASYLALTEDNKILRNRTAFLIEMCEIGGRREFELLSTLAAFEKEIELTQGMVRGLALCCEADFVKTSEMQLPVSNEIASFYTQPFTHWSELWGAVKSLRTAMRKLEQENTLLNGRLSTSDSIIHLLEAEIMQKERCINAIRIQVKLYPDLRMPLVIANITKLFDLVKLAESMLITASLNSEICQSLVAQLAAMSDQRDQISADVERLRIAASTSRDPRIPQHTPSLQLFTNLSETLCSIRRRGSLSTNEVVEWKNAAMIVQSSIMKVAVFRELKPCDLVELVKMAISSRIEDLCTMSSYAGIMREAVHESRSAISRLRARDEDFTSLEMSVCKSQERYLSAIREFPQYSATIYSLQNEKEIDGPRPPYDCIPSIDELTLSMKEQIAKKRQLELQIRLAAAANRVLEKQVRHLNNRSDECERESFCEDSR